MGYGNVDQWTLVRWRITYGFKGSGRWITSESLYRGDDLIHSEPYRGELNVFQVQQPGPSQVDRVDNVSVWSRIDHRVGKFGMPPSIAVALYEAKNWVYFMDD